MAWAHEQREPHPFIAGIGSVQQGFRYNTSLIEQTATGVALDTLKFDLKSSYLAEDLLSFGRRNIRISGQNGVEVLNRILYFPDTAIYHHALVVALRGPVAWILSLNLSALANDVTLRISNVSAYRLVDVATDGPLKKLVRGL